MKFKFPEMQEPVNHERSGIWKTPMELKQIANRYSGELKNKMNAEIRWIAQDLFYPDDLTNLTIEQAKLFRLMK
jgi:hypothetical protein